MRDSVFIRPHDATGNNLLDWSFIDEKVLAETCADGEPDKKKRKKKRTKRPSSSVDAAAAALDSAAKSELNIIEKIETKQVAFGATAAVAAVCESSPAPVVVVATGQTAPHAEDL